MGAIGMMMLLVTGMRGPIVPVCLNPATDARIVHRAEATASRIFASIGVDLQWQSDLRYCAGEMAGILITFGEPASERSSATLAYASPYEGSHIVVYFKRLRESVSAEVVSALLAHVLVHEIAHILQGVARHSSEGMMKQRWTSRDVVEMRWRPLAFTADDILLIRVGLQHRNTIDLAQAR